MTTVWVARSWRTAHRVLSLPLWVALVSCAPDVAVAPAEVATVTVSGVPAQFFVGDEVALASRVVDTQGAELSGAVVQWASSAAGIAIVDGAGRVRGVSAGAVTITASAGGKSGTVALAVLPPVATVTVASASATIFVGATQQLTATLRDAGNNVLSGRAVTWSSSNPTVASVSTSGLVTAGTVGGAATITASSEGRSGSAAITVLRPVATIALSPTSAVLAPGATQQLTATLQDADSNVLTGRTVTWTTSDPTVASVSTTGLVTAGTAVGMATITSSSEGRSSAATITVQRPVATVTLLPASVLLAPGAAQQLIAMLQDADNNVLTGRIVTYMTSSPTVASVSTTGLVTAGTAEGTATITAISEGRSGSATITVQRPVATIALSPTSAVLVPGETQQLTATLRDAGNNILTGRAVTWSSSNPVVASVSAAGLITASTSGTATITASVEGRSGSATVTVTATFRSCKAVLLANPQASSGVYEIASDGTAGSRTTAYCDMTTDGGGWTRVVGHRITNNVPRAVPTTSITEGLRLASVDSGAVSAPAMQSVRSNWGIAQVRFLCEKPSVGRRVHIVTGNTTVIDYLLGAAVAGPAAPGTFTRLNDDTSLITQQPQRWGFDGANVFIGNWGDHTRVTPQNRLLDHSFWISAERHWNIFPSHRAECDDFVNTNAAANGFWYVYVR